MGERTEEQRNACGPGSASSPRDSASSCCWLRTRRMARSPASCLSACRLDYLASLRPEKSGESIKSRRWPTPPPSHRAATASAGSTKPRHEPRRHWPRSSTCAGPQAAVRGRRGVRLEVVVRDRAGRKHLPVVELKLAALPFPRRVRRWGGDGRRMLGHPDAGAPQDRRPRQRDRKSS